MLKKSKITLLVASICVAAAITAISASASDKFSEQFSKVQSKISQNKAYGTENVVQVGNEFITKKELEDFKAYKELEAILNNNSSLSLSEGDLLEDLITEKLLQQKAREFGLAASLQDGKAEADRVREILSKQPQEVQNMQDRFIAATGLSKEEYWVSFAPKQYQEQLTLTNLINKLKSDGVITLNSKGLNDFGKQYRDYRKALYSQSLGAKVKALDKKIRLNQ